MLFKPFYLYGWTEEGIMYRKGQYVVMKPRGKQKNWLLRKVGGKPGKQVTEMEEDYTTAKEAFRAGNKLYAADRKAARKAARKARK